jgi:hypothetical protein
MVWLSARKWCRANQAGILKGVSGMTALFTRLTWCLAIVIFPLALLQTGKSEKPKRVVWKGVETSEMAYTYNGYINPADPLDNEYFHKIVIHFTYIEETDARGLNKHFVSKKLSWSLEGASLAKCCESMSCKGGGEVELVGLSEHDQKERLKANCTKKEFGGSYFILFPGPPGMIDPPKLVRWDQLRDNCAYSEEETKPWGERHTYSVWVSPELNAVMEVKTDRKNEYWQFVPEPGQTITFTARSNVPARFRFTLEDVSQFPGFATNAHINSSFFKRYHLEHLEGKYDNDLQGPDLIFNPKDFDASENWKPPDAKMLVVETAEDSYAASVPVTAMDYAAYGHLKAEAKSKCGGWQPVRIQVGGQDRDFVTIPMDENNNLIADRMEEPNNGITAWSYAGDPGSDDDKYPTGDGTPGDGLTLFEEYRGFMTASNFFESACQDRGYDDHIRTDPAQKDLFVAAPDLELAMLAPLLSNSTKLPGEPKGIAVHLICDGFHTYKRSINFTLDRNGPKKWHDKTLSLGNQHALRLIDGSLPDGKVGSTEGNTGLGPPKNVCRDVTVDKQKILDFTLVLTNWNAPAELASVVQHELGHGVGIDHNGDNDLGNSLLLTKGACPEGLESIEKVLLPYGTHACLLWSAVRRHGQHSGDQNSPMKYQYGRYYESPSQPLTYFGKLTIQYEGTQGDLSAYTGLVHKYRNDIDPPGLGRFPDNVTGTGINALPGEQNHAGDSCRIAAAQIRVNDLGTPPVQLIPCPADSPPSQREDICTD